MSKPTIVDESPNSVFVQEMKAAIAKRLTASGTRDKREVEQEIAAIMRRCLGRSAWDAAKDLGESVPDVPRATRHPASRRRARFGPKSKYSGDGFDHKLAAAGERDDDR